MSKQRFGVSNFSQETTNPSVNFQTTTNIDIVCSMIFWDQKSKGSSTDHRRYLNAKNCNTEWLSGIRTITFCEA